MPHHRRRGARSPARRGRQSDPGAAWAGGSRGADRAAQSASDIIGQTQPLARQESLPFRRFRRRGGQRNGVSVAMGVAAVTGATGFLGRRLVPALVASGWRVRVLVRRTPPGDLWEGCGPELVAGDLGSLAALDTLTAGADVLIHGAGLIKAARRSDFFAVNAEGARNAARAAPAGGLLLVSSLAAREPRLSDYAASKRAGEELALAVAGPRLTIVRPPAIYGPGDRETLALFRLAGRSPI